MNSKQSLHECRSGLQRKGPLILLPFEEAIQRPGYISVFGYPPETAQAITEAGSTAGLQGRPLSTRLIYLDIDDDDAAADRAEEKLQAMGLTYERYFSGNRGYHFHIPCEEIVRIDTPHRVKSWVGSVFGYTDDSIYKTSGIIRTPGTFHHKRQGSRKELVSSGAGKPLDLLAVEVKAPTPGYISLEDDTDPQQALDWLWLQPAFSGGRNREIYRRAFLCRLVGHPMEEAIGMLQEFNQLMVSPPLPVGEVVTATRSAYRG